MNRLSKKMLLFFGSTLALVFSYVYGNNQVFVNSMVAPDIVNADDTGGGGSTSGGDVWDGGGGCCDGSCSDGGGSGGGGGS